MRIPVISQYKLSLEDALRSTDILKYIGIKKECGRIFVLISKTRCNLICYHANYYYVLKIIDI